MNAALPVSPPEVPPSLVRAAIAVEPELARLLPTTDLDALVRGYLRQLRLASELERRVAE